MNETLKEIAVQFSKLKEVLNSLETELTTMSKKMDDIDKLENKVKQTIELEELKKNLLSKLNDK